MLNFSDTTWQLMEKSGLRMVFLGAETGSDATLKRMDKGGTAATKKTLEIAAKMETHNMVPEFSFVLGNPPEPEKDMERSLQFIRKIKRINPKSEIIMYLYPPPAIRRVVRAG